MALQIDEILKTEIPHILGSHGFQVRDHPDCLKLIATIIDHLKALLIDAQATIDSGLALERLQKIAAREKTYELWIYRICFAFVGFYKENLSLTPGLARAVPCDLSMLQVDYLLIAAQRTVDHVYRRDRHRPHGGRRRGSNIALPLTLHTVPSQR